MSIGYARILGAFLGVVVVAAIGLDVTFSAGLLAGTIVCAIGDNA